MASKKGQASLEFLATYGWAFIIILLGFIALWQFDILNFDRLLPHTCILPQGIGCDDWMVESTAGAGGVGRITLVLRNDLGYKILLQDISISNCAANAPIPAQDSEVDNAKLSNMMLIDCTQALEPKQKFREKVSIRYFNPQSGLTKTIHGTISSTVQ